MYKLSNLVLNVDIANLSREVTAMIDHMYSKTNISV